MAGRTARCIKVWKSITNDRDIIRTIKRGVTIEFYETPQQNFRPETRVQPGMEAHLDTAITDLMEKGVIKECTPCLGDYYSTVFLTPKRDGRSYRMILNLKKVKQFMVYHKFKMATVNTCIELMNPNYFMAAIDLSDAYFSIKVHPQYRKYLCFIWRSKHYEFIGLPQGLSCSPRVFTKVTKPVLATLQ